MMRKKDDTAYFTLESMIDMNPSIAIEELNKLMISFNQQKKHESYYSRLSLPEAHVLLSKAYAKYVRDESSRGHMKFDELSKAEYHLEEAKRLSIGRKSKRFRRYVSLASDALEEARTEID